MIARPVQALHYQMYSTDITRKIKKALERWLRGRYKL
jgi:hypothetical protein